MGVTGRSQFKAGVTVYVYPEEQAKFETISAGSYFWKGYFGTQFWIDRKEDMFALLTVEDRTHMLDGLFGKEEPAKKEPAKKGAAKK